MQQFDLSLWLKDKSRKVVTRSGHNVRILCTDQRGNMPIVALVEFETLDGVQMFYSDGKNESHREYDLFFADEEEELTEFELRLLSSLDYTRTYRQDYSEEDMLKIIKDIAKELFDLARKELRKEQQEKLGALEMPIYVTEPYYIKGKEDALKDLPKWRKCEFVSVYPSIADTLGNAKLYYKNHKIDIKELIEKLPKEE